MKKITLTVPVLIAAFAMLSTCAHANSTDNILITGTYDSSASVTAFSGPSDTFSLSFSVPTNIGPGLTANGVSVAVDFGGTTTDLSGGVITFFPSGSGGGLNVDAVFGTDLFEWQLEGSQLFDSSDNLVLGSTSIVPGGGFSPQLVVTLPDNSMLGANITSGTVDITPGTTGTTPEPSSLLLLGTGLLGFGIVLRRKFVHV